MESKKVSVSKSIEFFGDKFDTTIEVELLITATVYPEEKAVVNAPLERCHPGSPTEVEIETVKIKQVSRYDDSVSAFVYPNLPFDWDTFEARILPLFKLFDDSIDSNKFVSDVRESILFEADDFPY